MLRLMKFLSPLLLITVFCATTYAATRTAASCSISDVQAAINASAGGDAVLVPAGTCAWTSGITISGKGITLQGAGAGRIIAVSSSTLTLGTGTKTLNVTSTNVNGNLSISNGQTLTLAETGNTQNFMTGTVSNFNSGTLTMNITSTGGTCGSGISSNCARWLISTPSHTTINNNSTSMAFTIAEDSSRHTDISGIRIIQTGGGGSIFLSHASNGKAILVHDMWISQNAGGEAIDGNTNRGVIWNTSLDATPFQITGGGLRTKDDGGGAIGTSWTTPSTMGAADTTGEGNLYFENNDVHAYLGFTDFDSNSRTVIRYSYFDNAAWGSHGADTSTYGNRHFEAYNNVFKFDGYNNGTTFNLGNGWMFIRGGTFVMHDNIMQAMVSTDLGNKGDIKLIVMNLQRSAGPDACWGAGTSGGARYRAPRQIGSGYVTGTGKDGLGRTSDSFGYVGDSEPAYIWNNRRSAGGTAINLTVGVADYGSSDCSNPDSSANYIILGRDYFNNGTPKPGYTPFIYPHPLTQGTGSLPPPPLPAPPTGLQAIVN